MPDQRSDPLWIVVLVERGIPVSVEAFCDEEAALRREALLWTEANPEDDEVAVFEVLRVRRALGELCGTGAQ